jgi:hypothetical protein
MYEAEMRRHLFEQMLLGEAYNGPDGGYMHGLDAKV